LPKVILGVKFTESIEALSRKLKPQPRSAPSPLDRAAILRHTQRTRLWGRDGGGQERSSADCREIAVAATADPLGGDEPAHHRLKVVDAINAV
jgi:hypothetical protein